MLKAFLAATILTATMAVAQSAQEGWKGDLTGVWQGPYTGDLTRNTSAKLTPWGEDLFKKSKSSNTGEYTLKDTNDPVITKCFPPGVPRIYLQPFPWQIVQTPKET